MVIKAKGIIQFEPENKTRKHNEQAPWKRIAMIQTNDDLCEYYAWFIRTRFNLTLNKPLRGSHVTFINDRDNEVPNFSDARKLFDGKEITFYIDPTPLSNGEHWWLRVYCPDAEAIRMVCGGKPEPFFGLHLTLGYANEKNLAHSHYILNCCKFHKLIDYVPRQTLNDHQILDFEKC